MQRKTVLAGLNDNEILASQKASVQNLINNADATRESLLKKFHEPHSESELRPSTVGESVRAIVAQMDTICPYGSYGLPHSRKAFGRSMTSLSPQSPAASKGAALDTYIPRRIPPPSSALKASLFFWANP